MILGIQNTIPLSQLTDNVKPNSMKVGTDHWSRIALIVSPSLCVDPITMLIISVQRACQVDFPNAMKPVGPLEEDQKRKVYLVSEFWDFVDDTLLKLRTDAKAHPTPEEQEAYLQK